MNKSLPLVVVWVFLSQVGFAGLTVTTENGKILENAELQSSDAETALIKHSGGLAKIPLSELSKEVRQRLHIKPSLLLLRIDFEKAVEAAKVPLALLDEQYQAHLTKKSEELRQKGMLDEVLLIRKELEAFPTGAKIDYTNFVKLKEMRAVYDTQKKKRTEKGTEAVKSTTALYSRELKEMEVALTKTGDLEGALASRKEQMRLNSLLKNDGNLLEVSKAAENKITSISDYYVLVSSFASDVIVSANMETEETKILYHFQEKSAPRGIAVLQSGTVFVSLRYAGMNVVALTPKEDGGFDKRDLTNSVGSYGPGKLRISERGDLLIAGDAAGVILRFDLKQGRPMANIEQAGMTNVLGLDVAGDYLYVPEIFGKRVAKFKLSRKESKGEWLIQSPDEHMKRSGGIAVGHNGNLFITNTEKSIIPEFSEKTGEFVQTFFDMSKAGGGPSFDIVYVPTLKSYIILGAGGVVIVDKEGKLVKKIPLPDTVKGGSAIAIVQKSKVSKLLGDQL